PTWRSNASSLTSLRENTLRDVITRLEPDPFPTVTGPIGVDFPLLVERRVFNTEQMNQAVFAFQCYRDASRRSAGIESDTPPETPRIAHGNGTLYHRVTTRVYERQPVS